MKLLESIEKDYSFIYLQSYSCFDQEKLDAYYAGFGMTKVLDGCATYFYKCRGLSVETEQTLAEYFKKKF